MEDIKEGLYYMLNQQRTSFKKLALYEDAYGESVINELLAQNILQTGEPFKQVVQNCGGIVTQSTLDYLVFERQHNGRGSTLTQEDIKQGFEKALDDMINSVYKTKLLTSHVCTHIAIGLMQTGASGDVFRVSTLITKKALHIEEIIKSTCNQESGIIFVGKVLDPSKKPCLLIINKGLQQQVIVGPNKIQYSESDGGVFKICLPDNQLGSQMNISNLLSQNQQNTYEILMIANTDNSFTYGSGEDLPQNFNYSNLEQGFQELLPPIQNMKQTSQGLSSIFQAKPNQIVNHQASLSHNNMSNQYGHSRVSNIGNGSSSQLNRRTTINNQAGNPQPVSTHIGGENGIRKTKAQILKEQFAASKSGRNPSQATLPIKQNINQQQNVNQMQQNTQQQQQPTGGFTKWNSVNSNVNNNTNSSPFFGKGNQTLSSETNFVVSKPNQNPNTTSTDMSFQYSGTGTRMGPPTPFKVEHNQQIQPQVQNSLSLSGQNASNTAFNGSNPFLTQQVQKPPLFSQQNIQTNSINNSQQPQPQFNLNSQKSTLFQLNQEQRNPNIQAPFQNVLLPKTQQQPIQQQPIQIYVSPTDAPNRNFNPSSNSLNTGINLNSQQSLLTQKSINVNQQSNAPLIIPAMTLKSQQNQQQQTQFNFTNPFSSKQPQVSVAQPNILIKAPTIVIPQNQPAQIQQPQAPVLNFQHAQQTHHNNLPQQPAQLSHQLTQKEADFVQSCIYAMKDHLTHQQMEQINLQMNTNPRQLLEYCIQTHHLVNESPVNPQQPKQPIGAPPQSLPRIHEYDDLTLFLMTLPPYLIKNQQKFDAMILDMEQGKITNQDVLTKLIKKTKSPTNDSFKELYQSKNGSDLIVVLKNEEIHCHKIVFSACADYFKQALKRNEDLTKQEYGNDHSIKQSILIPDWMDPKAFKLLIKFIYTGRISDQNDAKKPTIDECLSLLKIANFFYIFNLQEQLIAEVILPQLNAPSAIKLLHDISEINPLHYNKPAQLWPIVNEYCIFFISKHLPSFLRQDQKNLQTIHCDILYKIIERSLYYIVDGGQDIENIIQFTADMWTNKDIMQVFQRCQMRFDKCYAFDCQIVPQMREFITQNVNYTTPYQCLLITGQEQDLVKSSSGSNESGLDQSSLDQLLHPSRSMNDNMNTNSSSSKDSEFDLANWRPANNYIRDKDGRKEVAVNKGKHQKEPVFFTIIDLDEQKEFIKKNQGITIMSEAFDFGRRSWHLKIDIDKENNISLWIIERGNRMHETGKIELGQNLPISFSSLLLEFEIVDAALGDCRTTIFYSFAHDTYQIIGQKNALNISQLQNKSQLTVRVHLKDYILHSALLHYYTTNLYAIFKKEHKDARNVNNKSSLLTLPFSNIYQILNSNLLKVEQEDDAFYFFLRYTQRYGQLNPKSVQFVTNLLSHCLRFTFMSFNKQLSGLRDNEYLRNSQVFVNKMRDELIVRSTLTQPVKVSLSKQKPLHVDLPRKFYDLQKMQSMGRKKYESMKTEKTGEVALLDELIEWAVKSHVKQKQASQTVNDEEVKKLKEQVYEERRLNSKLMSDLSILKGKHDELVFNNQRTLRQPLHQPQPQPVNTLKDNNYITNVSYEKVRYAPKKGAYPSPKAVPQFLNDSTAMLGEIGRNNNKMMSSFSSCNAISEDFNDDFRGAVFGGTNSVIQADQKVHQNLNQDLSAVLDRINRSSPNPKRNVIEDYKSQRGGNGADQCLIF